MIRRFFSRLVPSVPFLLFLMALCNLVIAWNVRKTVNRSSSVVVTNYVDVVSVPVSTNSVPRSPSPLSSLFSPSDSASAPDPSEDRRVFCSLPYNYFVAHRRIGAQICGRYFYEGSLCSGGRIDKIFPDRILLADGSFIVNSNMEGNRGR